MDPFVAIYSDLVYRVLLGLIAQNFIITADYVVLLSLASLELLILLVQLLQNIREPLFNPGFLFGKRVLCEGCFF